MDGAAVGVEAGVEAGGVLDVVVKAGVKSGVGAGGVKAGTGGVVLFAGMDIPKTAFAFIEFVFPFVASLLCLIIMPPLGPTTRSP
jgi:hypothetical protein